MSDNGAGKTYIVDMFKATNLPDFDGMRTHEPCGQVAPLGDGKK